jgi:hypothetical protein
MGRFIGALNFTGQHKCLARVLQRDDSKRTWADRLRI